jgi:hypothetical protein
MMTSAPLLTSCGCQRGIFEKVSTSAHGASSEMSSMIGSVLRLFNMRLKPSMHHALYARLVPTRLSYKAARNR